MVMVRMVRPQHQDQYQQLASASTSSTQSTSISIQHQHQRQYGIAYATMNHNAMRYVAVCAVCVPCAYVAVCVRAACSSKMRVHVAARL
jgi:hypothetical protein